jgi:hypothetical protein
MMAICAGEECFDLAQEFYAGLIGQLEIGQHQVGGFGVEARNGSFGAFRFGASEAKGGTDGHAQAADALLVIDDEETDFQVGGHVFSRVSRKFFRQR